MRINQAANALVTSALANRDHLRIEPTLSASQTQLVDFGIKASGGLEAGLLLARICMADLANISLAPADRSIWNGPLVCVETDHPVRACMAAQYAGWPVQHEKFFAMGSGPMRAKRGKEKILEELSIQDDSSVAVGVLECDQLPSDDVCRMVAEECGVEPAKLTLCVAPTRSLAGSIQVVARSVETCLHKLHELGFDLHQIKSAHGSAPLAPPAVDFAKGIGRTNDAILYGGHVTLWIDCEDAAIESILEKVPSNSSRDWGTPFAKTFKSYGYDFYKVDPGLFSPAVVSFCNLRTGRNGSAGRFRPDVLAESFAG